MTRALVYIRSKNLENQRMAAFLKRDYFKGYEFEVVALNETLPWYSVFAGGERLEKINSALKENSERSLQEFRQMLGAELSERARTQLIEGEFPEALGDFALEKDAQLFLRDELEDGKGESRSTDIKLVRSLDTSLFFIRNEIQKGGELLAAVAPSLVDHRQNRLCHRVLENALELCDRFDLKLNIVQCWYTIGEEMVRGRMSEEDSRAFFEAQQKNNERALDLLLEGFKEELSLIEYTRQTLHGHPTEEIHKYCRQQEPELIVLGSVARSGSLKNVLGSTAESVLRNEKRSIFITKI